MVLKKQNGKYALKLVRHESLTTQLIIDWLLIENFKWNIFRSGKTCDKNFRKRLLCTVRTGSDKAVEAHWLFWRFTSTWKCFERVQRVTESWTVPVTSFKSRVTIEQHFPQQILLQSNSDKDGFFSYWDLQTIFTITSTKISEFWHSSTRQSTCGTVLQHLALPHLLTGFSLQVLFPWMPEGIKSFFIFYYLRNMVRN